MKKSVRRLLRFRGVKTDDVQVDAFGDLRILRKSIVHNGGILRASDHAKLKTLGDICQADVKISPTHDQMHRLFVATKSAIGSLILEYTAYLPGAPKPEEIVDIAVQGAGRPQA
jgi:hypothetical protein